MRIKSSKMKQSLLIATLFFIISDGFSQSVFSPMNKMGEDVESLSLTTTTDEIQLMLDEKYEITVNQNSKSKEEQAFDEYIKIYQNKYDRIKDRKHLTERQKELKSTFDNKDKIKTYINGGKLELDL